MTKRLIEYHLPLADMSTGCLLSAASAREKNIRHGHIFTPHLAGWEAQAAAAAIDYLPRRRPGDKRWMKLACVSC